MPTRRRLKILYNELWNFKLVAVEAFNSTVTLWFECFIAAGLSPKKRESFVNVTVESTANDIQRHYEARSDQINWAYNCRNWSWTRNYEKLSLWLNKPLIIIQGLNLFQWACKLTFENMNVDVCRSCVWWGACVIACMLKLYSVNQQDTTRCRHFIAHFMAVLY